MVTRWRAITIGVEEEEEEANNIMKLILMTNHRKDSYGCNSRCRDSWVGYSKWLKPLKVVYSRWLTPLKTINRNNKTELTYWQRFLHFYLENKTFKTVKMLMIN